MIFEADCGHENCMGKLSRERFDPPLGFAFRDRLFS
jgi:hypothetical protein